MSRRFCELPQGFSESCAANCDSGHRHLSVREVREKEIAGEIEFLDHHPITNLPRYVVRTHGTQHVHIPAIVMERASGAYRVNPGEVNWARGQVREYGKERRGFSRLLAQYRTLELPRMTWTNEGISANFEADGPAPKGKPVRVSLKPRTPEAVEAAAATLKFVRIRSMPLSSLLKSRIREWRDSIRKLDAAWHEIVADISAGPFSEALNEARAGELPSTLVHRILEAFLEVEAGKQKQGSLPLTEKTAETKVRPFSYQKK